MTGTPRPASVAVATSATKPWVRKLDWCTRRIAATGSRLVTSARS